MKTDTPLIFGLHPNAEIGFRTSASNTLFTKLTELQPKSASDQDSGVSAQDIARNKIEDIKDKISDVGLDLDETISAIDDRGPFENVFLQEMSMLILLVKEIRRSLKELLMGFDGELSMSSSMERLEDCLSLDKVPENWGKKAWPSLRSLSLWVVDLLNRIAQIQEWSGNPNEIPRCTWLGGLIIPESFLTAIKQIGAQRNNLELDKLVTLTEVTKKTFEQIDQHAKDGAFISGMYMQGARWDQKENAIAASLPKEMFYSMPVMLCKSVLREKDEDGGIFRCPVYKAENRGPTYVFSAQLKTKSPPARWVLAGVGLIFDITG
eukprot:g4548.t1